MVSLASHESGQYTVQGLYFVVEIGTSPRMQRDNYLSCDEPDLGAFANLRLQHRVC